MGNLAREMGMSAMLAATAFGGAANAREPNRGSEEPHAAAMAAPHDSGKNCEVSEDEVGPKDKYFATSPEQLRQLMKADGVNSKDYVIMPSSIGFYSKKKPEAGGKTYPLDLKDVYSGNERGIRLQIVLKGGNLDDYTFIHSSLGDIAKKKPEAGGEVHADELKDTYIGYRTKIENQIILKGGKVSDYEFGSGPLGEFAKRKVSNSVETSK